MSLSAPRRNERKRNPKTGMQARRKGVFADDIALAYRSIYPDTAHIGLTRCASTVLGGEFLLVS